MPTEADKYFGQRGGRRLRGRGKGKIARRSAIVIAAGIFQQAGLLAIDFFIKMKVGLRKYNRSALQWLRGMLPERAGTIPASRAG
jgi:hypothetical protein